MSDWRDIEKLLCDRVEAVCRHLLPNGKVESGEWVCGDIAGHPGRSLKVNLAQKVGIWCDFADGGKGGKTLMSLWCSVRGQEFRFAIKEAKQFLGVPDDSGSRFSRPGGLTKPKPPTTEGAPESGRLDAAGLKNFKPLTDDCGVFQYLAEVRKLDPMVIDAYRICQTLDSRGIVFPYFPTALSEDDEVIETPTWSPGWFKFEALERKDGKKVEWTTRGPEKCLFGKNVISPSAREVIITEGEKDAMAWATYGFAAVSVPFGAKWKGADKTKPSPNREWIDRDYPWLEQFETIYVSFDSDVAGKKAAMDVINEIGPRRCKLVTLPHKPVAEGETPEPFKDANDCLLAGVTREQMTEALTSSREFAPEKIKNAAEFRTEFFEDWFEGATEKGLLLPIDFPFKIRRGEVTIWTGFSGHGKTKFLNYALVGLMTQGERACIASMEVRTRESLNHVSRQAWGGRIWDHREKPKNEARTVEDEKRDARIDAEKTLQWLSERLWLYNHVGIVPWETLLEDFKFVRRRYGVTQFVIDSLMRCGIMEDDYPQQSLFVTKCANFADEFDCHVHLVAHRKKDERGEKSGSGGDKSVVSGSAKITDNAHNVVEIWRNVDKGQKMSELWEENRVGICQGGLFQERLGELQAKPDGRFILRKQRNGELQDGAKLLWFLFEGFQYTDKPPDHKDHRVYRFVE